MGGTYTLLIGLAVGTTVRFGAAGDRTLDPGGYAYIGSALGPGGFARLDRHREIANGTNETRHWHIDYLLGHEQARLIETVESADTAAECRIARDIHALAIDGIGASDCSCDSHLFFSGDPDRLLETVEAVHAAHS